MSALKSTWRRDEEALRDVSDVVVDEEVMLGNPPPVTSATAKVTRAKAPMVMEERILILAGVESLSVVTVAALAMKMEAGDEGWGC